jgi:ParB/RepB/Spo0J family partition protein
MKIKEIGFTKSNSRTLSVDRESLHIDSLADSIEKNGLISPIVLIEQEDEVSKYKIIAGQRRFLALSQIRGENGYLTESEYVIRESGNPTESEAKKEVDVLEVSIVENQFRESLSPMDLNRAALKLNQKGDYKDKEIAKILNITPYRLKRIFNLGMDQNKMSPEIIEELKKGGDDAIFTDAHWDKMRDIDDPQTQKDVFDHIMEKQLPPRELPSLIKSVQKANDEAYGEYDDEGGKGTNSSPHQDDDLNDSTGPIKYKHKGVLTMETMDNGEKVFRVEGRGEDGDVPIDHYLEYLSHPEKFKCKVDLKLTFIPLED